MDICSKRPWDDGSQGHCDHQKVISKRIARVWCCWCGRSWEEQRETSHGPHKKGPPPAKKGSKR